jgi:tRNA(adenine34) deaminase
LNESAEVVAVGWNDRELTGDPTGHAEIVAIRNAVEALGSVEASESKSRAWSLEKLTLVVTLEPCVMCAGAIVAARIPRVVFGAWDARVGAGGSLYDLLRDGRLGRPVEVIGGVLEAECSALMTQFFETKRISGSR